MVAVIAYANIHAPKHAVKQAKNARKPCSGKLATAHLKNRCYYHAWCIIRCVVGLEAGVFPVQSRSQKSQLHVYRGCIGSRCIFCTLPFTTCD